MVTDVKIESIDKEWINKFYDRVTDLFILSRESLHNTHQWAISMALGFITVILAINGNENTFPNELSLIITLLSFPLLLRFFIRSCLECAIQYRFMRVRDTIDWYLSSSKEKRRELKPHLLHVINCYYFHSTSPTKLVKIIWDNLRLAYFWIFIVWIGLITWGIIIVKKNPTVILIFCCVVVFSIYEILSFLLYKRFRFKEISINNP
jgi:hypothetical protein